MENITVTEPEPTTESPDTAESPDIAESPDTSKTQINLLTVPIDNEMVALNVLIGFIGVAQKRGAFAINESAKLFECIKKFTPVE